MRRRNPGPDEYRRRLARAAAQGDGDAKLAAAVASWRSGVPVLPDSWALPFSPSRPTGTWTHPNVISPSRPTGTWTYPNVTVRIDLFPWFADPTLSVEGGTSGIAARGGASPDRRLVPGWRVELWRAQPRRSQVWEGPRIPRPSAFPIIFQSGRTGTAMEPGTSWLAVAAHPAVQAVLAELVLTAPSSNPPTCDPASTGRELAPGALAGERVRVHVNLHNGCFTVGQHGRVAGYTRALTLRNVTPHVSPAGWRRCHEEQVRNVHAYLEGELASTSAARPGRDWSRVRYNCLTGGPHFTLDDGRPFEGAAEARCVRTPAGAGEAVEVFVRAPVAANPSGRGDDQARRLERAAAQGDLDAKLALAVSRWRLGQPVSPDAIRGVTGTWAYRHVRIDAHFVNWDRFGRPAWRPRGAPCYVELHAWRPRTGGWRHVVTVELPPGPSGVGAAPEAFESAAVQERLSAIVLDPKLLAENPAPTGPDERRRARLRALEQSGAPSDKLAAAVASWRSGVPVLPDVWDQESYAALWQFPGVTVHAHVIPRLDGDLWYFHVGLYSLSYDAEGRYLGTHLTERDEPTSAAVPDSKFALDGLAHPRVQEIVARLVMTAPTRRVGNPTSSPSSPSSTRTTRSNPGNLLALVGIGAGNPPSRDRGFVRTASLAEARDAAPSGLAEALRFYPTFHGSAPTAARVYRVADGQREVRRVAVVALGRVPETHYSTPWESTKKGTHWVHKHPSASPPLEVLDPVTRVTSKLGGTYAVRRGWWRD